MGTKEWNYCYLINILHSVKTQIFRTTIDGFAEATGLIVNDFSGALSDYLGNRKWLAVAGYVLGALSKRYFAIALHAGNGVAQ